MGSIYDWSTTALSNANADSDINWAEGQDPGTVNDSAREMMRKIATFRAMQGGEQATTGTSTAYVLTYNHAPSAYVQGMYVCFEAHVNSGASATLNINALGAISLRNNAGAALTTNDLRAGSYYMATYDASAGHFLVLNVSGYIANLDAIVGDISTLTVDTLLDVTGNFTSVGITDSTTTKTIMTLTDGEMQLGDGAAAENYRIDLLTNTDGYLELGGGAQVNNGANLRLYGSTHATSPLDIELSTGAATRLLYDWANTRWDFSGENVVNMGDVTMAALTSTGIDDNATKEVLQVSDTSITLGDATAAVAYEVRLKTITDGTLIVSGGPASSAANILMHGSTHATRAFDLSLRTGTTQRLFFDHSLLKWDFNSQDVDNIDTLGVTGLLTAAGDLDVTGQIDVGAAVSIFDTNNVSSGPDILLNSAGLIAADDALNININANGGTDDLIFRSGTGTSAGTEIMRLTSVGVLTVQSNLAAVAGTFTGGVTGTTFSANNIGSAAAPALRVDADGAGGGVGIYGNAAGGGGSHLSIAVDGSTAVRFKDDPAMELYLSSIYRDIGTDRLDISGGVSGSSGGNIELYGGTHATLANDINFRSGTTLRLGWDHSALEWDFNGNDVTGLDNVVRGETNNNLVISGGSATNLGANIVLYGESHATLANDMLLRVGTTAFLRWDNSANAIELNDNDLKEVNSITFTDGSVQPGANGQWSTAYNTTATQITTSWTLDNTIPLSTEGQALSGTSISSVVVAAGEQVEIHASLNSHGNGESVALVVFRDTTAIGHIAVSAEAANNGDVGSVSDMIIDTPGAGTYTYSCRVASLSGGTTSVYINSRINTGTVFFGAAGPKSGIALRLIK